MPRVPGLGHSFDALGHQAYGLRGPSVPAVFLSPRPACRGHSALAPLAHASPPDPLWIPGFYGDADDDAESLVAESADQSAA